MKQFFYATVICTLCLGAIAPYGARADDTEVYVTDSATAGSAAQPNVLFVFDTSGSMGWNITTKEPYDPTHDYGSSSSDYYYFYEQDYDYVRSVHGDFVQCQSLKDDIASQPTNPVSNDRVGYWFERTWQWWLNDGWNNFSASSGIGASNPVECAADSGIHGADADDPNTYAADGDLGLYSSDSGDETDWSDRHRLIAVSANYHDYLQDTSINITRRKTDIMKDAAKDLVDDFDGLNFGLMRFSSDSQGGYVVGHFEDITPAANKTAIKAQIDLLPASGGTPLTETLWEAARYMRGDTVDYGTASVPTAVTSGSYNSPMTHSCQKNHIVYLTDGEPYSDSGRDSAISTLTGQTCSHSDGASLASQTCFDEMAGWLNSTDHSSTLDGEQEVTLHTIGFDIELDLLSVASSVGGGGNYNASDASELRTAFNTIVTSILSTSTAWTAPAVTVNAYNNLQHRDEFYYALFEPSTNPRWAGNIKRYRITNDAVIRDANGADAISDTTGFFRDSARSYWSSEIDGSTVAEGGFAEQMSALRNVYTYTGSTPPDNVDLNDEDHLYAPENTLVTNAMLGLSGAATAEERAELMQWVLGTDVEDVDPVSDVHKFIADPLHSSPVAVTYGGTEAAPDDTVFATTNLGVLHAIDADDGSEEFAFIPQELLDNGIRYLENDPTDSTKTYGLDGQITVWREENHDDTDATIEPSEGDHVYLYLNMRRGGGQYYALDVTDRQNPTLMWQIDGGAGDFLDLAQTWSAPKLANVRWGCTASGTGCSTRTVLIFGGGYDTIHDTATSVTTNDAGAAVFMVDAETGALLWSAGRPNSPGDGHDLELAEMDNSIPADLTLVDTTNDGYLDMFFGVDIVGNVWRFDINETPTGADDFATGGRIALLGDYDTNSANDAANFRRFYYAPDVAFFAPRGGRAFFSISMTSGYRAHPRDATVTDRVFVLFDQNVFDAPRDQYGDVDYSTLDDSDTDPLDESDLFDATSALADRHTNAPYGWYKTFQGTNEKGLARSTTFNRSLLFTTYLPTSGSAVCGASIGSGRVYVIDALTGGGLVANVSSGTFDEYVELMHVGIPPAPVIIFTDSSETYVDEQGVEHTNTQSEPVVCVGTECFDDLLEDGDPVARTYWRENS